MLGCSAGVKECGRRLILNCCLQALALIETHLDVCIGDDALIENPWRIGGFLAHGACRQYGSEEITSDELLRNRPLLNSPSADDLVGARSDTNERVLDGRASGVRHHSHRNRGAGAPGTKLSKTEHLAPCIESCCRRIKHKFRAKQALS